MQPMTETPVSEMDFKLRLDLAGLCNNAADTLEQHGETGEAFDLREVARFVAELKAGTGTLAEFCDVLCLPMPPAAPAWNPDMAAAPRDGTQMPWVKNPDYDTPGFTVELFCGDKVLVAVPLMKGGYETHLITPTETGFDDAAGEMWSDWAWSDVEYYCIALPPLPEVTRCRS